jgi:hypothetical protein
MQMREVIRPPVLKDPLIKVRVLAPLYVGGVARAIGDIVELNLTDALAMQGTSRTAAAYRMPVVEILK